MRFCLLPYVLLPILVSSVAAKDLRIQNAAMTVQLSVQEARYDVSITKTGWEFRGILEGPVTNGVVRRGTDRIGKYDEINFEWSAPARFRGSIRVYHNRNAIVFAETALESLNAAPPPFPSLRGIPANLHLLTYSEHEFGVPPVFASVGRRENSPGVIHSGPVVLFDDSVSTCIISPASDFMVAGISEAGEGRLSSGLLSSLRTVPKGFSYKTLLVWESGVNSAWETWGHFLTDLYGKKRPSNEADVGLRYLGYWTDNGATYYYNYDTTKGYEGTLLAEKRHLDSINIPVRYLQLDSWWYLKGFVPPDGHAPDRNESKTSSLPAGEWNRYGGLLEYVPAPELFPRGLKAFRDSLGIPLITHNRWIERDSPYRQTYRISGIGAVDRRWWEKIISQIKAWGVVTYEQDWLSMIYRYSPEFSTTTWAGNQFLEEMSSACARHGMTMQYCMALPRHFLAGGAQYSNLTSIRVSGDRFEREKWKEFLYGSRMASALGVWPWADVFMSRERDNLLLATLSGGMVGIGDAYGSEDPANVAFAVRPDGVIVKPDVPIVPTDPTVLADAKGIPACRTAYTFSQDPGSHGAEKTVYLFSYNDSKITAPVVTRPADIGLHGKVFVYDFATETGRVMAATDSMPDIPAGGSSYSILAAVGPSTMALIGDPGKFVSRGRQRIDWVRNLPTGIEASVIFGEKESSVTLVGFAPSRPGVATGRGSARLLRYDTHSGQFTIELTMGRESRTTEHHGDAPAKMDVRIALRSGG